jgi:hypothetical protein
MKIECIYDSLLINIKIIVQTINTTTYLRLRLNVPKHRLPTSSVLWQKVHPICYLNIDIIISDSAKRVPHLNLPEPKHRSYTFTSASAKRTHALNQNDQTPAADNITFIRDKPIRLFVENAFEL